MLIKKIVPLLPFVSLPLHAQDSLLLRDYGYVKQYDPWLTHKNAAALTRYARQNIVEAEAFVTKGNGGLVDYTDSRNTLEAGACVESFYRLSRRVVGYGAISYANWTGRDMTGSAFMQDRMPFNLVEDSLTNDGRKHRDTYRLTGGLGVDVWQGISFGARLDYTSANYAKYKDLRHKNKLMDLSLTLGAYAPVSSWMSVGADYTYQRTTESVTFGAYGKSDKVYKTLIDYGAMMGRVEQFGNEGFTDKSREMPFFEDGHGGSLQLELRPWTARDVTLFASLDLHHETGYYGRKSPYTITYTNHGRDVFEAQGRLSYGIAASRMFLDMRYAHEKTVNRAETYRPLINDAGSTYYEYYDAAETGTRKWDDLSLHYTLQLGLCEELPGWQIVAGYQLCQRQQTAYLYPFFRYQHLKRNTASLAATRNLIMSKGVLSVALQASYGKGSGEPCQDGTFTTPDDRQEPPATMEAFLLREYRYLTAAQYGVGGSVKYAFRFPGTRLKTHARVLVDYRTTSEENPYTQGNGHVQAGLAIGCTF